MAYTLEISEKLDRVFAKLSKKDKLQFEILSRKIKEILEKPQFLLSDPENDLIETR